MILFGKKLKMPSAADTELSAQNHKLSALKEAENFVAQRREGIKILGTDSSVCASFKEAVDEVLVQLYPNEYAEIINDLYKIAAYGVIYTPALVIDGRVVCTGRIPSKKEIASLIKKTR